MTACRLVLVVIVALTSACGGGGTTGPSSLNGGLIEGTWHGSVTYYRPTPMTVPTTFTFHTMALTSGTTYDTTATWIGPDGRTVTSRALISTALSTQFSTSGVYPSPNGCDGSVGSYGTVDAHTIDATFTGSSHCDAVFEGHLLLSR